MGNRKFRQSLAAVLAFVLLLAWAPIPAFAEAAALPDAAYEQAMEGALAWVKANTPSPKNNSVGGEWAVQALAPYYMMGEAGYNSLGLADAPTYAQIREVVDKAVAWLSGQQNAATGDIGGSVEAVAQTMAALSAIGVDAGADTRFVKNGRSLIDALLAYRNADGSFRHMLDGSSQGVMSTEQAAYALVAYDRYKNNMKRLYDMGDATDPSNDPCRITIHHEIPPCRSSRITDSPPFRSSSLSDQG